jgi:hypothetical protein
MMLIILRLPSLVLAAFRLRSNLALENLALRQQLAIMKRRHPRPRLRRSDRVFWLLLSRAWSAWRETLVIVKPDTVVRWHRKKFASYWTRLSRRSRAGRPALGSQHPNLTQQLCVARLRLPQRTCLASASRRRRSQGLVALGAPPCRQAKPRDRQHPDPLTAIGSSFGERQGMKMRLNKPL